jgi:hypothetical protein
MNVDDKGEEEADLHIERRHVVSLNSLGMRPYKEENRAKQW